VDLEPALHELSAALTEAGIPLWQPPESLHDLQELEAELAPLRLPEAARRFWTLVDAPTLRVVPYPGFITPEMALTFWRLSRDEFRDMQPLALVCVGYASHRCMSVELGVGDSDGGALFEWYVSDASGFTRRFNALGDWVAYIADLVRRGLYRRLDTQQGPVWDVPGYEDTDAERALRPTPDPHPVYGTALHVGDDILDWPEHWQRVNGVREEDLRPRGATHTIAEVLASDPSNPLVATIGGKVTALAAGASARVRVDDGTGALDVFCPANATLLGPRISDWFEFDIVVDIGPRRVPPDPDQASAAVEGAAEKIAAVLMARHGGAVGARARAVRRMPAPPHARDR
jgi:hypothetical protein